MRCQGACCFEYVKQANREIGPKAKLPEIAHFLTPRTLAIILADIEPSV